MALWDSKKTHCSPSFVSNGNRKICYGQLKYWTSVKKGETEQNYWKKYSNPIYVQQPLLFLSQKWFSSSFVRFSSCGWIWSHVVGKVIMGTQWDHDIVHFLPNRHKTIRLLHFLPPPLSPAYWLSHRYIAFWSRKIQEKYDIRNLQPSSEFHSNVMKKLHIYVHINK